MRLKEAILWNESRSQNGCPVSLLKMPILYPFHTAENMPGWSGNNPGYMCGVKGIGPGILPCWKSRVDRMAVWKGYYWGKRFFVSREYLLVLGPDKIGTGQKNGQKMAAFWDFLGLCTFCGVNYKPTIVYIYMFLWHIKHFWNKIPFFTEETTCAHLS